MSVAALYSIAFWRRGPSNEGLGETEEAEESIVVLLVVVVPLLLQELLLRTLLLSPGCG